MSIRIFIGSPFRDHNNLILNACQAVQERNPQWRIVQPDSWHVTYCFPGNIDEYQLQEAKDVCRLIAQDITPYTMEAEGFCWMPVRNKGMLWLQMKNSPQFETLFHRFHKELGLTPSFQPNPHVTIMRGNAKKLIDDTLPIADVSLLNQHFAGINLYRSFLQPGGSRYEVLNSF